MNSSQKVFASINFSISILFFALVIFMSLSSQAVVGEEGDSQGPLLNCQIKVCKLVDQTEQVLKPVYSGDNFEQVQTCNSNLEDTNMWISESVYASSQYYALQELEERYYLSQDKNFQTLLSSQFTCLTQEQILALQTEAVNGPSNSIPLVSLSDAYIADRIVDHEDGTFTVIDPRFVDGSGNEFILELRDYGADLCRYYGFGRKVSNHAYFDSRSINGRAYNKDGSFAFMDTGNHIVGVKEMHCNAR